MIIFNRFIPLVGPWVEVQWKSTDGRTAPCKPHACDSPALPEGWKRSSGSTSRGCSPPQAMLESPRLYTEKSTGPGILLWWGHTKAGDVAVTMLLWHPTNNCCVEEAVPSFLLWSLATSPGWHTEKHRHFSNACHIDAIYLHTTKTCCSSTNS